MEMVNFAVPSENGALHVEGRSLVDEKGRQVQLRGISTHGIEWYPAYNNAPLFKELHEDWKANVIRLAMYTSEPGREGYVTSDHPEKILDLIREGIRFAKEADLYVIVDWHILSDNDPNLHTEEAKAFFDTVSSEFAGEKHVLYEICNEPNGEEVTWEAVRKYVSEVIPVIRKNAPEAPVLCGTPRWSQRVDLAAEAPLSFDNVLYVLHFYAATHKEALRDLARTAIEKGLPLFVSEYGICEASGNGTLDYEEAEKWLDFLTENGISFVSWNFSNCDESGAMLKKDCEKVNGFSNEDLNDSGKWQKEMLHRRFQG